MAPIERLLLIMARLRDPETGCPWDLRQSFASIVPYTIEEAYEVADAVDRGDLDDLRDELGDLLFQVVFQSRLAEEAGAFGFDDVASAIADKMVRRHPHVFGEGPALDPAAVAAQWEAIKAQERAGKARKAEAAQAPAGAGAAAERGTLAGVPLALPALTRAEKVSRKAAAVGFDWPDAAQVVAKVREETDEVAEALAQGDPEALAEEIGDLLFSVANLARHARVDPEEALRRAIVKFRRRFAAMEDEVSREGRTLPEAGLAAMEEAWARVKRREG
ncbi:Nucleoside triphosphate pyrophosphohydrolase [Methylobacterium crusticola]|uniref:Nucleoside triphosphate pyrophosphohydrolase n=1 Tax=Methylobacterium crusticola TaxID=1697972 RepID=A0ABQ4QSW3_9HYPH|nr:nucleoside triphosphate pyrophosphohydrolase [Methylobacterium crusticola]GJD48413.1 Nucleoside triphosphate pyrophosphohydrolase [Methylobacterium crusticola]